MVSEGCFHVVVAASFFDGSSFLRVLAFQVLLVNVIFEILDVLVWESAHA